VIGACVAGPLPDLPASDQTLPCTCVLCPAVNPRGVMRRVVPLDPGDPILFVHALCAAALLTRSLQAPAASPFTAFAPWFDIPPEMRSVGAALCTVCGVVHAQASLFPAVSDAVSQATPQRPPRSFTTTATTSHVFENRWAAPFASGSLMFRFVHGRT
jgi:hypothetical protein